MANTTTTTTQSANVKVTNAAMMRIAVNILAAMPADALQKLCGEYRSADVVSKAKAHLATLEKQGCKAEGPTKAAVENAEKCRALVAWWVSEGSEPMTPKEVTANPDALKALGMAACSSQKANAILAQGAKDGITERFFDGVGTWLYRPVVSE